MNVTEDLVFFAEERIKVQKDEAGKITLDRVDDKLQVDQDTLVTR